MRKSYKFEKIHDSEGDVRAYKLGSNYLIKHYYFNNNYEWLISRGCEWLGFDSEILRKLETGEIEIAFSCKQGKERLIGLFEQESRNN